MSIRARSRPGAEALESRSLLSGVLAAVLTTQDVATLLSRAARATPGDAAIVAVVDREGRPLGVRVEGNVSPAITGSPEKLVFAVDGALAEARTGAMFAGDKAALTSRTAQNLAQSTMTQREIQADPNVADPSTRGPGFVAPIGANADFPSGIKCTPQVGPFEIEHTNRDSIVSPGPDHVRGTADDILLASRFNANPADIPAGKATPAPESRITTTPRCSSRSTASRTSRRASPSAPGPSDTSPALGSPKGSTASPPSRSRS